MDSLIYMGAVIAIILSGVGVAIGEWWIAKTSIKNLGINPELQGTITLMTVLGITLVESCAIYGLIIAFQIIGADNVTLANSIWAGLVVGIPGMVVGLIEWWIARNAIDALLRNPEAKNKILISMILFITLIESCAIYGLIIAFQILGK